jgi:S1-C subfamily serine protease
VSVVILVGGWFGRPHEIADAPAPVPSETELEQLARRAERRSLEGMTQYFDGVSREAATSIARMPDGGVSGIIWDERRIVVPTLDAPPGSGTVPVMLASTVSQARPDVWGPNLPVAVLLLAKPPTGIPARRAPSPPPVGGWVVAVWKTDVGPAFGAGTFHQHIPTTCADVPVHQMSTSLALNRAMLGGGLFDVEGHLLGVIVECGAQLTVLAAASVEPILGRNTIEQRLLGWYGIAAARLSPEEQAYFKTGEGLMVREVWIESHGDVAGLRPGDIILTLNGQPVTSPADLAAPATSGSVNLMVRRGRTTLPIELGADKSPANSEATGGAGVEWASVPRTLTIDAVRSGSREQRAGLQPGDQVLRIDQVEPRTLDQVNRRLRASTPVLVEVARDRRRVAILVR